MRVRLVQSTGGTKYFIITKVEHSGGTTTVTLYGGTDYDLNNEAISSPYYSVVKAPVLFPLNPAKWTVTYTDTTRRTRGSAPTTNVWYNLASQSLSIPLGVWDVTYQMSPWATAPTNIECALSTSNNSVSDQDLVGLIYRNPAAEASSTVTVRKTIALTAKTTHYPIVRTQGSATNIGFLNDWSSMIVRAICAYL
jgi:hypothetical protein